MTHSVLITGASTGIGEDLARHLAARGWRVFAGVRRASDGERLATTDARILPVLVDVTDPASITACHATVAAALGDAPLDALVNNAGIAVGGPLEFLPVDELRRQFEVNVFGLVAVTQAMLPLLRRGAGRIVNIGSIGGRVTTPMVGPYCASKFAVEAISDALRMELAEWGLSVVLVEPGVVVTPIWDKGASDMASVGSRLPPEALTRYDGFLQGMARLLAGAPRRGVPVAEVSRVVARALTVPRPRHRYVIGRDAKLRLAAQTLLPRRWMDAATLRFVRGRPG